jgi:hypothetical protein
MPDNPVLYGLVASLALLILFFIIRHLLWKKERGRQLAALSESEEYDILYLWKYRFVLPCATGQSITHITAEIQNLTDKRLQVVIRPGTYFVSSGNHQNMVTRTRHSFRLTRSATVHIEVPASCINAECPVPDKNDRFRGVAKVSKDLIRFLGAAEDEHPMVIQAGVWAITDRYTKADVQRKLFVRDQSGRTWAAISDEQVATAKYILDELGIRNYLAGKPWWRFWK